MINNESNDDKILKIVRVAACNFYETILDTDDLSAVRGGSLLLLEFPKALLKKFEEKNLFEDKQCIAKGASELLFMTTATEEQIKEIYQQFIISESYRYFTFVHAVARLPDENTFKTTLDKLVRECNLSQYRQPTVKEYAGEDTVCGFTGVLPATREGEEKKQPIAAGVKLRRDAGRRAKQSFYKEYQDTAIPDGKEFANEFSHMRPNTDEGTGLPESLKGKMVVLYLDGNSFRKARESDCARREKYRQFSDNVTAHRRKLLTEVVQHVVDTDKSHDVLRLETLLWGGDEAMWVLPAFKAWEFMQVVQRNLNDKGIWGDDLTHSCGLLIAPYKAPIKDLRALVNSLGDVAKECPDGRKMNGVQIEFIKGFDLPGLSAGALRGEFLTDGDDHRAFQLDGSKWGEIDKAMRDVKKNVPRSALQRIYQQAAREGLHRPGNAAEARDFVSKELDRIETVGEKPLDQNLRGYLTNGLPGAQDAAACYPLVPLRQILQLWDLVPEKEGGAQ